MKKVLVVDEVWDSGTTIAAVTDRVRQAGGIPTTAVLHYKPTHSVVEGEPDVFAVQTDLTTEIVAHLVSYVRESEAAVAAARPTGARNGSRGRPSRAARTTCTGRMRGRMA